MVGVYYWFIKKRYKTAKSKIIGNLKNLSKEKLNKSYSCYDLAYGNKDLDSNTYWW